MNTLAERVVIVTGAASGIGAETARFIVEAGGRVVISDIDERGANVAKSLGDKAVFQRHDVRNEDDWDRVVGDTVDRWGRIDGLVNNAAVYIRQSLTETTLELFDEVTGVELRGHFLGMKAFARAVPEGSQGSIVNVSSAAGLAGAAGLFAATTVKWAVRGMSRAAARDLGPMGIRVNCILPGVTDTPVLAEYNETQKAALAQRTLRGRIGEPGEVARTILFLLSDESSFVAGAELSVDGGIRA